ncbi:uncharacterized protein BDZ99DRAFT_519319 [Mytilinidion resinicola]|uniref:Ankyrin n=1 Tax=Mytilinidion resinicola TaxID=574789 RepID=A0A6A6YQ22_9PEZI|nr:uncharacterized protein BDZ99DRAFT_519319 [Mytilinidion resinicola]KAF2810623.1 hypothetical protein BDZ99DRAFT_519319 [Mytilinidion resinicola]
MSLLSIPIELHLEVASYCKNEDLGHLIRTHSLLNMRLQNELHKRALSWRPEGLLHDKDDGYGGLARPLDENEGATLEYALVYKRHHLVDYLLRHNIAGIEGNGNWSALQWATKWAPFDVMNKLFEYAINGPTPLNTDQVTRILGIYLDRVPQKLDELPEPKCGHGDWCECGWAVSEEELQVFRILLLLGADPMGASAIVLDPEYNPPTAVPFTFRARNGDILRLLAEAGADIHWQPPQTTTQIMHSTHGKRLTTVLYTACFDPEFPSSVVLELLKRGADPNCQGPAIPHAERVLPLFETMIQITHPKKSEHLLDYGVDINTREEGGEYTEWDSHGNFPIHQGIELTKDYAGTWARVISRTPDLEVRNYDGETALQAAISCGSLQSCGSLRYARLLIEAGADVNVRDQDGRGLLRLPFHMSEADGMSGRNYFLAERMHFLANYGLETQNLDLIPTEEALEYASHLWDKSCACSASESGFKLLYQFELYWKVLMNVLDALERVPDRGGTEGRWFRDELESAYSTRNAVAEMRKTRERIGERYAELPYRSEDGVDSTHWLPQQWDAERQKAWWIRDD